MVLDLRVKFDEVLYKACELAQLQESFILREGIPLSLSQIVHARQIGVVYPNRVRIRLVPVIPIPDNPILREACAQTQFITSRTVSLTLQYGILIRSDYAEDCRVFCHELAHVVQYERLGDIRQFLKQYFREFLSVGYSNMSMEQEAIKAEDIYTKHQNK